MTENLLSHVVGFTRTLRREGIRVTPGQTAAFARALGEISIFDPVSFYYAAQTTLVNRHEDLPKFSSAFQRYWKGLNLERFPGELLQQAPAPPKKDPRARPGEVGREPQPNGPGETPPQPLVDRALTYAPTEVLRQKRFDQMSEAELEAARKLLYRMVWNPPLRRTRRLGARGHEKIDLRQSLRQSLRHQGEVLQLVWRARKRKPRPIVALADVSGSMERYARMLLHFLYAFSLAQARRGARRVETFTFGTRLTRITRTFQKKSVDAALTEVGREVKDWSGGTRIGACLHTFNHTWAKRVLGQGSIVLIISDGWDQGEPELLAFEMERLQKSCHRLIWLNPLLGTPGYQPLTRGLVAALPYVDDFLPVHNLSSLEKLVEALDQLEV
ncbi:MAG: VWA domain-containing protein [Meiothermus sp.]|uniref:vWA domain-containing protein n=1 Tax=Meiothermus sp. TaxID=1955249 RepID=UPI0025D5D4E3|nr:VWA domain-containing protein [Meiothermus sp.]MCS7193920.1 VWA domain-containing protein [Meiothermus sp.]MDW8091688.1 VWA domain-containing protein [Meiothermus sp.]MDW8481311.1 VWA domain-containing protein [Meiothermus sp.]